MLLTGDLPAAHTSLGQVSLDYDCLEEGDDYEKLKTTYVIFICTFDYLKEAEKRGKIEGIAEGETSGRAAEKLEMAKALKAKGVDIDIIAETSSLSKEDIEKL